MARVGHQCNHIPDGTRLRRIVRKFKKVVYDRKRLAASLVATGASWIRRLIRRTRVGFRLLDGLRFDHSNPLGDGPSVCGSLPRRLSVQLRPREWITQPSQRKAGYNSYTDSRTPSHNATSLRTL